MSLKISRKLFNNYNKIFEVTFEDGSIVEGTYKVQCQHNLQNHLKKEEHNSYLTAISFVVSAFPDTNKFPDLEKTTTASRAIEIHIKDRIEKFVMKNF